jgi:hypothetical protein
MIMSATTQQVSVLRNMLTGLSNDNKQILRPLTARELAEAVIGLVNDDRKQLQNQAIGSLVTGAVSNWNALETAAAAADGATLYDALAEFTAALQARNANALVAQAVRVAVNAKKHLGV